MCFLPPCWLGADEELFELNPEEYIRRDIEGSGMVASNTLIDFEFVMFKLKAFYVLSTILM